ncbi:MAG: sulfatase family protein [Candidatus Brocadiia bacterium]
MPDTPNIVYILADDEGYGDVGCYNPNCKAPTPVLDRMAEEGMRFTDSHTSSAVCTPTRYSVLTGRYNWRSRLRAGVLTGESPALLEDDRETVASLLHKNGYRTACVGKWHLGLGWHTEDDTELSIEDQDWDGDVLRRLDYTRPVTDGPNDHGFDYSFIIPSSLDIPPYVYLENGKCTGIPSEESKIGVDTPYLMRRGMAVPGMQAEDVLPTFRQKAVETISDWCDSGDDPFFLYLPLSAPHTPIVPTEEYRGTTEIGLYGDFVTQIDALVGEVLGCLEENGCADDTLVIFTSDNGASPAAKLDELKEMGHDPNAPWRGTKADIYEGGHRTPFIARWPGVIEPGSVCNHTVCTTDLMATVASVLGEQLPEDAGEDSYDMTPLLRGEDVGENFREATVHHSVSGHFAIRKGKWKLLEARGSGGWSYPTEEEAEELGLPEYQLYDMEKDPGETTNLARALPEKVDELRRLLDRYRNQPRSVPKE